jgi:uracil-DNA glycosylase family protein
VPSDEADYPPAPVPARPSKGRLRSSIAHCRACDLWEPATQAVLGEGPRRSRVVMVGEQPGDREDIEGRPFVGPAGGVLDRALKRAGIERSDVYLTNAVKHFRFRLRGKRRIHQTPDRWQVSACQPWLDAELSMIRPEALVCLGAVAAQGLLGSQVRIGRDRGRPFDSDLAELVVITAHPSSILRVNEQEGRERAMDALVADLSSVAEWLRSC